MDVPAGKGVSEHGNDGNVVLRSRDNVDLSMCGFVHVALFAGHIDGCGGFIRISNRVRDKIVLHLLGRKSTILHGLRIEVLLKQSLQLDVLFVRVEHSAAADMRSWRFRLLLTDQFCLFHMLLLPSGHQTDPLQHRWW